MHIPDGYLGPKTFLACYALAAPFWWRAWSVLRKRLHTMEIPHVALAAAFIFVIMMFNIPAGPTTGHAVGASIAAIVLGPWAAVLAVSFALLVQALLFGDGGITAFGANCLNLAIIQPFVSLFIWNILRPRELRLSQKRTFIAAFAAGYFGLLVASFTTAVQFGIQPALERAADGTPLYSPYPLSLAIPGVVVPHFLFSIIEGMVTGFIALALARDPHSLMTPEASLLPAPTLYRRKSFWALAAVVILAVPIGLWLPEKFNAGDAWGEWSPEEAAHKAGLQEVPAGMKKWSEFWHAPVPDYSFKEGEGAAQSLQYIAAAIIGVILITFVFMWLGKWQKARLRRESEAG